MNRREFLSASIAGVGATCGLTGLAETLPDTPLRLARTYERFLLEKTSQSNQGIVSNQTGVEDYGFCSRPLADRLEIIRNLNLNDSRLSLFAGSVNYGQPLYSSGRTEDRVRVIRDLKQRIWMTRPVAGEYCSIIPGTRVYGASWKRNSDHAVELLKRLSEEVFREGVTLLLEPVDYQSRKTEMLITNLTEAYEICDRVNHPGCQILFDIRPHQRDDQFLNKEFYQFGNRIGYYQFETFLQQDVSVPGWNPTQIVSQLKRLNRKHPITIGNFPLS